jgi:hypothetical protein
MVARSAAMQAPTTPEPPTVVFVPLDMPCAHARKDVIVVQRDWLWDMLSREGRVKLIESWRRQ